MFLKFLLIFSLGCATASMVIENNTLAYTLWQRPPVTSMIKVYLFNYTNWENVKNGEAEKLHVEEVGPYVYTQKFERVNINIKDDVLEYQEKKTWTFLPEKSTGEQFDHVYVPNLPLLGISSLANNLNLSIMNLFVLNHVIRLSNHPDVFVKLRIPSFLWGYDDSIIDMIKPFLDIVKNTNYDKFGLLVQNNGTSSNRLAINTGAKDIDKINIVEQLNGFDHMNFWGNPACNSVKGSEGTRFPISWLDRNTTLQILFPDLCRRLPFIYEKEVKVANQEKLLRYRLPANVFDNPETNPDNQCYCEIDTGICPPRGVINITACSKGFSYPAFVSFPHFYLGDPQLREQITGLKSNPEEIHETFLDVHPASGITLNRKSAFQLNVQVKKVRTFTSLGFLKQDMILPIAWVDITEELKQENVQLLINNQKQDSKTEEQKEQHFEEYVTKEVREIQKQISNVMDLLSTINKTQSEFVNKVTDDITLMKNKINNIPTKLDIASLQNNNCTIN